MAGTSSIITDNSIYSKLDQALFRLESWFTLIGGIAVFMLMLLAVVSVTGRNGFNQPLPGYVDWIEQAMPIIAFLGISYCQRTGGHIRMDILVGQLSGRFLWLAEFISLLVILILMLAMVWGSWAHFERSFDFAEPLWSRDSSLDIRLPLWPAKLLVPMAFSVLCLRLILQLWSYGKALINGTTPIGVPVIEDAATIAAKEAATVSGFEEPGDK